jgi:hypothetical protein
VAVGWLAGGACRRASWRPRKLETDTGRGRGKETKQRIRWAALATRGSKRPQPRVDSVVTKGVLDPTATKDMAGRTGGRAHYDRGRTGGMLPQDKQKHGNMHEE